MLRPVHALSPRCHDPSLRLFSKGLAGPSKQGWLNHCWIPDTGYTCYCIKASDGQWLTEGVLISWAASVSRLSQLRKQEPPAGGILCRANTPYRGVKKGRESRSGRAKSNPAHALQLRPVPTTKTARIVSQSYISDLCLRPRLRPPCADDGAVCISAAPVTALAGFIPNIAQGVWLARGRVHRILACLPFFHGFQTSLPPLPSSSSPPPAAKRARFEVVGSPQGPASTFYPSMYSIDRSALSLARTQKQVQSSTADLPGSCPHPHSSCLSPISRLGAGQGPR